MSIIANLLLAVGANLVTPVFKRVVDNISDPLQKQVVKAKLDALSAGSFVNMEAYFYNEIDGKDREGKTTRVISAVDRIVTKAAKNPKSLFSSSLDTSKFVENEISKNGYPKEIVEDGTTIPYVHFLSSCIELLKELPELLKEWELAAWSASFDKLDFLSRLLQEQTANVLKISEDISSIRESKISTDKAMVSLKSALRQAKARTSVEMTGLSRVQPTSIQLQSIFVSPELGIPDPHQPNIDSTDSTDSMDQTLGSDEEIISYFTHSGKVHRIIGPAGSGKTTLVRWIEQWHWQSSQKIAVRCDLRFISKQKTLPNVLDLFASCIPTEYRGTLTQDDFRVWIDNGKTVIIFDGFDEVSIKKRDSIEEWIKSSVRSVDRRNSFIITSRKLTTDHMNDNKWNDQPALYVKGFDIDRVKEYIQKWQEHMLPPEEKENLTEDEMPENLAATFTGATTINELTSNPLLLSTLMMVHRFEGKKLPDGRSDLYRTYVDGMLGPWYQKATSSEGIRLDLGQMRRFLTTIAAKMQATEITSVDEKIAIKWINEAKPSKDGANKISHHGKHILEHMLERTGLLIGPGEYQFAHKSIGEYLVAEAIVKENFRVNGDLIDRLYLLKHANEDSWRVVLFLWAGLVQSLADLLDFSHNLMEKGHVAIAIGLLEDRLDPLLEDYSEKLEELLTLAVTMPEKECVFQDEDFGNSRYVGFERLPSYVPGRYSVISGGHLEISGVRHFQSSIYSRCLSAGLLKPESFKYKNISSCFYFELWTCWISQGLTCNDLINLRPSNLSKEAAVIAILQHRELALSEDMLEQEAVDVFFIPFIVETLFSYTQIPYSFAFNSKSRFSSLEGFLKIRPMEEWNDYWFLLDASSVKPTKPNKLNWDEKIQFPILRINKKKGGKSNSGNSIRRLINQYRTERTKRYSNALSSGDWKESDGGDLEPTHQGPLGEQKFDDIYGKGSLETVIKILDDEMLRNGQLVRD